MPADLTREEIAAGVRLAFCFRAALARGRWG